MVTSCTGLTACVFITAMFTAKEANYDFFFLFLRSFDHLMWELTIFKFV
jgi:hypothetical protein